MGKFGWDYPAGAEFDPNAPYNQEDAYEAKCAHCGFWFEYDLDENNPPSDCPRCIEDRDWIDAFDQDAELHRTVQLNDPSRGTEKGSKGGQ